MKLLEYEDKEQKKKARAVDVESLLGDMEELEQFFGSTQEKIYEHYYQLKRDLLNALTVEIKEEKK